MRSPLQVVCAVSILLNIVQGFVLLQIGQCY